MNSQSLSRFAERVREQLFQNILPFWCGPAVDHENGGWMAWLSNVLLPDRSQAKGLIVNSRILWTFSAVYRFQSDALFRQMADRAFDVVMNQFWDQEYGGAFWQLTDDGRVRDDSKKTYGQAFCIYALVEYHRAFGESAALSCAQKLFDLVERFAHDEQHGGYWEVCRRDWSEAEDMRLSEKDMNEKKSMNNHLHVLEAYTNLYRVWNDGRVGRRLYELITLFEDRIIDTRTWHLHHFYDDCWNVRSDMYTFGHDIEASWLLCEAAEVLDDPAMSRGVRTVALRIAEAVFREGLDADGGLCYEAKAGCITDPGKEWWPQAEAIVGFINAFQLSGDDKYLNTAWQIWNYIENFLVDRIRGEWFWRINADGRPEPTLPKVSEWKGPYHASRACIEVLQRIERILRG